METFKEWFDKNKTLMEMPYVYIDDMSFDFELENLSLAELEQLLKDLINGVPKQDKYNNVIQLKTPEEKIKLRNQLFEKNLKKSTLMASIMHKFGNKINPIIRPMSIKPELRTPEEIEAYTQWVNATLGNIS
jgi:hypothetical protein